MTPNPLDRVCVALVHYQTSDLLEAAVGSFREVYPTVDVLLVDNGSTDGSADTVRRLAKGDPNTAVRMLDSNRFHGPAMDLVLQEAQREFVFFLDTDTVTRKGGFLEAMVACFDDERVLAAGQVVLADHRGFASERGTPVPASAYMMVRCDLYRTLTPFVHHGLPVLATCEAAAARGLVIASYPVESYVDHLGRGTAARFGYGLGLRSRIAYLLHRLGL